MSHYTPFELGVRFVIFRVSVVVTCCSILANFLPNAKLFQHKPRTHAIYEFFIDYVALFACNWRANLPSLDQEILGFRRKVRHAYRNWRQRCADRQIRSSL